MGAPPAPPAPPAPNVSFKPTGIARKKNNAASTLSADTGSESRVVNASSSREESVLNLDDIKQKAQESQKRQELTAVKDHLMNKLIDLILKIGDMDLEDVEL